MMRLGVWRVTCGVLMSVLLSAVSPILAEEKPAAVAPRTYETRDVLGWTLHIEQSLLKESPELTATAVKLLQQQLQQIVDVVPAPAVKKLREVPLWFCPEYPGTGPRAEYHPGRQWLIDNNRNPEMWQAVEFTNIRIFEAELERMPNFALHELAHAYHDRVFGFDDQAIALAHARAKESQSYDNVERWNGKNAAKVRERAYAMTNPMEYFAETSEAYFARNDFFPFNREELVQHDPEMAKLLAKVWGTDGSAPVP
jgi:hypothetical protein